MSNRLVVIGDVHGHPRLDAALALVREERPDLVILAGDVGVDPPRLPPVRRWLRRRHDASIRRVLRRVARALRAPVVWVPGNHDMPDPVDEPGAVNADGRRCGIAGLSVAGLGGAGPHRFGFPYEWSEAEAGAALDRALGGGPVDVLLSHTPPARTRIDLVHRGEHVGSEAVRARLGRARPALFVCGHIHEAWGVERVDGVVCLNAGALAEPFGQEIAWTVTWEDGAPHRIESRRRIPGDGIERRDWLDAS